MYVEQTSEGFNIVGLPLEAVSALCISINNQTAKSNDEQVSKEEKLILRKLARQLEDEIKMQL
jgi:hypothetical protein